MSQKPDDNRIRALKFQFNLSAIMAALTAASSLYIVTHMDDGKRFDMHALVPKIVEAGMTERPERNREEFTQEVTVAAGKAEQNMRYACGFFSLMGGGMILLRRRQLNKALENGPR